MLRGIGLVAKAVEGALEVKRTGEPAVPEARRAPFTMRVVPGSNRISTPASMSRDSTASTKLSQVTR